MLVIQPSFLFGSGSGGAQPLPLVPVLVLMSGAFSVAFALTAVRVAACCSVLQRVAVRCSVMQWGAVCSCQASLMLPLLALWYVLQRAAVCCSELQCVAVSCSMLQCVAV